MKIPPEIKVLYQDNRTNRRIKSAASRLCDALAWAVAGWMAAESRSRITGSMVYQYWTPDDWLRVAKEKLSEVKP